MAVEHNPYRDVPAQPAPELAKSKSLRTINSIKRLHQPSSTSPDAEAAYRAFPNTIGKSKGRKVRAHAASSTTADTEPRSLRGLFKKSFTNSHDAYHSVDTAKDGATANVLGEGWEEYQLTDLRPETPVRLDPAPAPTVYVDDDPTPRKPRRSFFRTRRKDPLASTTTSGTSDSLGLGETSASTRTSAASPQLSSTDSKSFQSGRTDKSKSKAKAKPKGKKIPLEFEPLYRASTSSERARIGPTMLHTPAAWALNTVEHERMFTFAPVAPELADGEIDGYTRHGLPARQEDEGKAPSRVRKLSNKLRSVASKISLRSRTNSTARPTVEPETAPEVDYFDYFCSSATYARLTTRAGPERHPCYAACFSSLKESAHRLDKCVCQCTVCAPGKERRRPPAKK